MSAMHAAKFTEGVRWRRRAWVLAALVVSAALPAGLAHAQVRLQEHTFAPGSRLAGGGDGRLITVERGSWRLSVWSGAGELRRESRLPVSPEAVLSSLAVRPPWALVAVVDPASPGLTGLLVGLDSGAVARRFEVPVFPASLFPAPGGWLVQEVSFSDPPRLFELSEAGTLGREWTTPAPVWERAQALGKAVAAAWTVATAGSAVWAIPAGWYELWELSAAPPRVLTPPPCLAVSGHLLSAEAAAAKMGWRYGQEGRELAGRLKKGAPGGLPGTPAPAATSPAKGSTARPRGSFFPAVLGVTGEGAQLAVLLDVAPAQPQGGCRVDLWDVRGAALRGTAPLAGPCPLRVALAGGKVWLYEASNQVSPLPAEAFGPPPPCPSSPPPGPHPR